MEKIKSRVRTAQRLKSYLKKKDGVGGIACAKRILDFYGLDYSDKIIDSEFSHLFSVCGMNSIMNILRDHGLGSRALHCDRPCLVKITVPAVLYWDMNRFVLLKKISNTTRNTEYIIFDPLQNEHLVLDTGKLDEHYCDVLIEPTGPVDLEKPMADLIPQDIRGVAQPTGHGDRKGPSDVLN